MKGAISPCGALLVSLFLLLGLVVSSGPANAVLPYTITDLGTLGGSHSWAAGINASGQVVGGAVTAGGDTHAFLWQNGAMQDLGTLGGTSSYAYGINDSGQVVGGARTASGSYRHAFLWEDGVMQDLGTLSGNFSRARGINNLGQVVGYWTTQGTGNPEYSAFLWEDSTMRDLGEVGPTAPPEGAHGINDSGQVAGCAYLEAFLWEDGAGRQELGHFGGYYSWAYGINESGQVVGGSWTDFLPETGRDECHAFLWEDGVMYDLGTLGRGRCDALSINNLGQVVGLDSDVDGNSVAFLWENDVIYDLNTLIPDGSGWELYEATCINDLGQVVGHGTYNGQTRAFLLTPIPEPSALGLLAFAFVVVMRRLRRG